MVIEQIYTGCLAQGAYYIQSEDEALVIDPLRETGSYLQQAERNGARIKYILETHFHADFVSGHVDLARETGAQIVLGPGARPGYEAHIARDGEELVLGALRIQVLHTPGHTLESVCYLLKDETGMPKALFSGDTLFIGDVGRPDLAQKSLHLSAEDMAGMLYDSLRSKIMPLSDDIVLYPAHGAGSACGKNMSSETTDTLGHQKRSNYALDPVLDRPAFIRAVLEDLEEPPAYFPENVRLNVQGYERFSQVLNRGLQVLSPEAFEQLATETRALVLDTRKAEDFAQGFVPNSINIGIDGSFAPWVGTLIQDVRQPILVLADPGREREVVTRLSRVGFDQVLGYLEGGFPAWQASGRETDQALLIDAGVFVKRLLGQQLLVIDLRKPSEFQAGHLEGALNIPLDRLNGLLEELPHDRPVYLHCAGGYRSMIAHSMLQARGWLNLLEVRGGYKAIAEQLRKLPNSAGKPRSIHLQPF